MEWVDRNTADVLIGCPSGRIDEDTWEAFLAALTDAISRAAAGGVRLIVDLSAVDYMSSRGLRALSVARKIADQGGVAMSLAAPNERMREILAISRYDKIFVVAPTIDTALSGSAKG